MILPLGITLANWTEPTATDNSGNLLNVIKSHEPGTSFTEGNTTVSYTFTDEAGNPAVCSFLVTVAHGRSFFNLSCLINCKIVGLTASTSVLALFDQDLS